MTADNLNKLNEKKSGDIVTISDPSMTHLKAFFKERDVQYKSSDNLILEKPSTKIGVGATKLRNSIQNVRSGKGS